MTKGKPIIGALEVPLSSEYKEVLNLAGETSERLGHARIEPKHLLIAMFRVERSLAAQVLRAQGLETEPIPELILRASGLYEGRPTASAQLRLDSFLVGLKSMNSKDLIPFFAKNAAFIDASGKRWNREEIKEGFDTLFAPYAKKNASYAMEATPVENSNLFVAHVLWKNALLASEQRAWTQRMTFVLLSGPDDWEILLAQVTPVQFS